MSEAVCQISVSSGKDSSCLILLALEREVNARYVFADTGNEHPLTYEYLEYLQSHLNITIDTVKADFSKQIEHQKDVVLGKWVDEGSVNIDQANEIVKLLKPTGIPFLDLCIWKSRFPSSLARFCSSELKHVPLDGYVMDLIREGYSVESWQGVRADESRSRSQLSEWEDGDLCPIYRPILHWSVDDVFNYLKKHGLKPNPLYKLGMARVGCMPCIHSRKYELSEIAKRFPEVITRIRAWEAIVSKVSKTGSSTFFHASTDPVVATKDVSKISTDTHGIDNIIEWAMTSRGGRQIQLNFGPPSICSSMYGLCE